MAKITNGRHAAAIALPSFDLVSLGQRRGSRYPAAYRHASAPPASVIADRMWRKRMKIVNAGIKYQ